MCSPSLILLFPLSLSLSLKLSPFSLEHLHFHSLLKSFNLSLKTSSNYIPFTLITTISPFNLYSSPNPQPHHWWVLKLREGAAKTSNSLLFIFLSPKVLSSTFPLSCLKIMDYLSNSEFLENPRLERFGILSLSVI